MSIEEKQCKDCGLMLPVADFYRHPLAADGFFNSCKDCHRERSRQWDAEHPESARRHRKEAMTRWRGKEDPDALRARRRLESAAWRAKNPERRREQNRLAMQRYRARKKTEAAV